MRSAGYGALLLALAAPAGHAGEFSAGYTDWNYAVSGTASDGDSTLDFETDLDVRGHNKVLFSLAWNTGPGRWPDLAAAYAPIRASGRRTSTTGGGTGLLGIPLESQTSSAAVDARLRDIELSLRYPLHLGPGTLSFGTTLKQLRGEILVQEEGDDRATREPVDQLFPQLHVQLETPLGRWLRLQAGGNYIRYREDRAWDYRLQASVLLGPLTLGAGWQVKDYQTFGGSRRLDVNLAGATATVGLLLR